MDNFFLQIAASIGITYVLILFTIIIIRFVDLHKRKKQAKQERESELSFNVRRIQDSSVPRTSRE